MPEIIFFSIAKRILYSNKPFSKFFYLGLLIGRSAKRPFPDYNNDKLDMHDNKCLVCLQMTEEDLLKQICFFSAPSNIQGRGYYFASSFSFYANEKRGFYTQHQFKPNQISKYWGGGFWFGLF